MNTKLHIKWHTKCFNDLTPLELHDILRLRCEIFILEQNCAYADIDGYDTNAIHIFAEDLSCGKIICALRILDRNTRMPHASIGRIVTDTKYRNLGVARDGITKCIDYIKKQMQQNKINLSGQYHLLEFYKSFGFCEQGAPYLEDDIKHVDMLLEL